MEGNNTNKSLESSEPPIQSQPIPNPINNQKGNTLIVIGIIFLAFLVVGAAYYFGIYRNNLISSPIQQINPSPSVSQGVITNTPKPTPTSTKLSVLLEKYKDYSVKTGNVYNKDEMIANTIPFEDKTLKVSLLYPKNLYFKAGMEPKAQYRTNPGLLIAMTNTPTSKYYPEDTMTQKDYIDYSIDCRIDPNPDGMCAESIAPWLDISIHESSDIQDFSNADVENMSKFKSISTQRINLDGSHANSYQVLYPSNSKNFVISFTSTTNLSQNEDYIYAIWLLLNSFQAN